MSTFTFDQTFEALVGLSGAVIVLSSFWIVTILIQIEKTKASAFSSVVDEDKDGTSDLQFEESTTSTGHIEMTDRPHKLEVETSHSNDSTSIRTSTSPDNASSPSRARRQRMMRSPTNSGSPGKLTAPTMAAARRNRRVPWSFVGMQIASVAALILLTYLLLVVSNAPIPLRGIGSLIVFGIFLRYQIGDEIRRQRLDRIALLLSLFLLVASMLSLLVFSFKTLKQGEIYEGPARIVGYDMSQYNNSKHDPTTRTDIAVSWGKDWGCPLSGGKVCQSEISGAMCQVHPDKSQTKHKFHYDGDRRQRVLQSTAATKTSTTQTETEEQALEEDLEDEENENENLESENANLEKENEELKKEVEGTGRKNIHVCCCVCVCVCVCVYGVDCSPFANISPSLFNNAFQH
jgi:hypothetical protein